MREKTLENQLAALDRIGMNEAARLGSFFTQPEL
jgi:hypothetical protein